MGLRWVEEGFHRAGWLLARERPTGREVEFLAVAGADGVMPKPFGVSTNCVVMRRWMIRNLDFIV